MPQISEEGCLCGAPGSGLAGSMHSATKCHIEQPWGFDEVELATVVCEHPGFSGIMTAPPPGGQMKAWVGFVLLAVACQRPKLMLSCERFGAVVDVRDFGGCGVSKDVKQADAERYARQLAESCGVPVRYCTQEGK